MHVTSISSRSDDRVATMVGCWLQAPWKHATRFSCHASRRAVRWRCSARTASCCPSTNPTISRSPPPATPTFSWRCRTGTTRATHWALRWAPRACKCGARWAVRYRPAQSAWRKPITHSAVCMAHVHHSQCGLYRPHGATSAARREKRRIDRKSTSRIVSKRLCMCRARH